jgi:hypothetical protein
MSDSDGALGTWKTSGAKISMKFDRTYVGTWDQTNSQYDGTYTGPDNGTWAMVPGSNNGQNCIQP